MMSAPEQIGPRFIRPKRGAHSSLNHKMPFLLILVNAQPSLSYFATRLATYESHSIKEV